MYNQQFLLHHPQFTKQLDYPEKSIRNIGASPFFRYGTILQGSVKGQCKDQQIINYNISFKS